VIGVPIRNEDAAEASQIEDAIQQAIKEAEYVMRVPFGGDCDVANTVSSMVSLDQVKRECKART